MTLDDRDLKQPTPSGDGRFRCILLIKNPVHPVILSKCSF